MIAAMQGVSGTGGENCFFFFTYKERDSGDGSAAHISKAKKRLFMCFPRHSRQHPGFGNAQNYKCLRNVLSKQYLLVSGMKDVWFL